MYVCISTTFTFTCGKMDWELAYHELLIRLKQWRRLFENIWIHWQTAEGSFQVNARWDSLFI